MRMAERIDAGGYSGPLEPSGIAWTWWRGDSLPVLPLQPGLTVEVVVADAALANLNQISVAEALKRVRQGNRPYVAHVGGEPVGYGWVAPREASLGGGRVRFPVPATRRSLWDFATRPAWRGRGIYPLLLQAILAAERAEAERFLILHEWYNRASRRGIAKAGFQAAATIVFLGPALDDGLGLVPYDRSERAPDVARFLGLPLLPGEEKPHD